MSVAPVTTASLRANHGSVAPGKTLAQISQLPKDKQFPEMLSSFKKEIALALPAHLTADRMARLAMTAFRQEPKLALCRPSSVFAAVILSAQLGLEIGVDGQAYIIPYKQEATFIPGWKGYVELINRAGRAGVWTGAVYKGDEFDYAQGDSPFVKHKPMGAVEETPDNITHVYAIGRVHGAQYPVIDVWPIAKVIRHRNKQNKVGNKHYSYGNLEMYGRKVALLQVMKYMPKSVELRAAQALDGRPAGEFDMKDVLDGEWSHVTAEAEASDNEQADTEGADNNENQAGADVSPQQQDSAATTAEPAATVADENAVAAGEANPTDPTPTTDAPARARRGRGSME